MPFATKRKSCEMAKGRRDDALGAVHMALDARATMHSAARARESNKHCDREIETPESTRLERRRKRMRQRGSTVFRGEALVM